VVNSSLELNEVLRIVMDTIIRLTGAERGFLMLRDEKGQLSTRTARIGTRIGLTNGAVSQPDIDQPGC